MKCDVLGQPLEFGDVVLCLWSEGTDLSLGFVVGFTPKTIKVCYDVYDRYNSTGKVHDTVSNKSSNTIIKHPFLSIKNNLLVEGVECYPHVLKELKYEADLFKTL